MKERMLDSSNKESLKFLDYILYTFGIAWSFEILLMSLHYSGLINGTLMKVIHYLVIAFGAGFAPTYGALIINKKYNNWSIKTTLKAYCSLGNKRLTLVALGIFACIQLGVCCALEDYGDNPWYLFPVFVILMIFGGGMEELGWRGIMQPYIEKKLSIIPAILVQGIIWAFWHLPLWFVPGTSQATNNFFSFMIYCVVFGSALFLLYRLTNSVAACILLHAWGNTTIGGMFTMNVLRNAMNVKTVVVYCIQIAFLVICYVCIKRLVEIKQNK